MRPQFTLAFSFLLLACGPRGGSVRVPISNGLTSTPPAAAQPIAPTASSTIESTTAPTVTADAGGQQGRISAEPQQLVDRAITNLNELLDTFFDYNAYTLGSEAVEAARANADILKQVMQRDPALRLTIEGHCDERGSAEYNLALGDRRALSVKDMLVQLGVPESRMDTVSYGDTRPQCGDANEACWQKNRRAHIVHYR